MHGSRSRRGPAQGELLINISCSCPFQKAATLRCRAASEEPGKSAESSDEMQKELVRGHWGTPRDIGTEAP